MEPMQVKFHTSVQEGDFVTAHWLDCGLRRYSGGVVQCILGCSVQE